MPGIETLNRRVGEVSSVERERGSIEKRFGDLDQVVSELEVQILNLESKLESVLNKSNQQTKDSGSDKNPIKSESPLASGIANISERVGQVVGTLRKIQSQIEL